MPRRYEIKKGYSLCEVFTEATKEELRVLLAVIDREGDISPEELCSLCGLKKARVASAVALWEEAGVLSSKDTPEETDGIEYEFKKDPLKTELTDKEAVPTARVIREEGLAELFRELPAVLGGPTLSTDEVKKVAALVTELGLSPEYIITLAVFLTETRKRRVHTGTVLSEAKRLADKGIGTEEELERYIGSRRRENALVFEIGKEVFGIRGRSLSDEELECFTRWGEEYGYGAPIIRKAYSYAAHRQTSGYPLGLVDYILTEWHKAGCKTVSECEAEHDRSKDKYKSYDPKTQQKSRASEYGDFDPEEAMKAALLRSYGETKA